MGAGAASWDVKTASPERVASVFSHALGQIRAPSGALVFASGRLADNLESIAGALAGLHPKIPIALAGGGGVLTERGEIEDQTAAAGLVWSGGRVELTEIVSDDGDVGESLAHVLGDRTGKTTPTVLLLLDPEGFSPSTLVPLRDLRTTRYVFGAGSLGRPGVLGIDETGRRLSGSIAMILRGMPTPAIRTTHSCRLLGPLRRVTECRGALLAGIDGEPALDVLARHAEGLADHPLLLLVLADEPEPSEGARPSLVVRGIQGVDPDRGAIVVSDELREGMRVTFAVRDGRAAREDFEAMTRELERDIAGAAPRFGIYVNCSGRGSTLYGAPDVDTKILRARFPGLPFAGLSSSFEIAPYSGRPTMHLYTGVFALFAAPS